MSDNILYAFLFSFIASISTLFGFFLIYKKNTSNIVSKSLALAAGTMIYISLFDLLPAGNKLIKNPLLIIIIILIVLLVSHLFNNYLSKNLAKNKLFKMGCFNMFAITLHNIPEGIATFITSFTDIKLGISLFISIMIHNIPEGISIALPIYYSTSNKKKAFIYTLIGGLSEFLGSILAYMFLLPYITDNIMGFSYVVTAGIMIYICLHELIPTALKSGLKSFIIYFIIGSLIMLLSHLLII